MEQESNLIELTEQIVLEFDGVSRFPKRGRASRSGEYAHPSIKIAEDDDEYTVNIEIYVYYGVNIPQLCYDIQTGLIHSLMEHAGVMVRKVNIIVEGVDETE